MGTGIKIVGGGKNVLAWNLVSGYETGIDIQDSWANILAGNIVISKKVLARYGNGLNDLASAVIRSRDYEALVAIGSVLALEPDAAVSAWVTLGKKFGTTVGNFSFDVLKGVLSVAAYDLLKRALGLG